MKRRRAIAVVGISVLAACAAVTALALGPTSGLLDESPARSSSQADYPVLPELQLVSSLPSTLTSQVQEASLIVDATVLEVLPNRIEVMAPDGQAEKAIAKKTGQGDQVLTFGAIRFKVNEILLGSCDNELTLSISPFAIDSSPNFRPGDRMILFLFQDLSGNYFSVSMQDSYYYVAKDSKVYPAVVSDQLKQYSGQGLGPFKSSINALKKELKKAAR